MIGIDVETLKQSAESGDAEVQFNLGVLYYIGKGVPQDYAQAVIWYHRAANQGLAQAQFNLGDLYVNGHGVPKDYAEAALWYRKAAVQGYARAQYNLGFLYARGWGVLRNRIVANVLYNIAAAPIVPNMEIYRDDREERMTPAEIADAQALASEMAKPGNFLAALDAYLKESNHE